MILVFHFKCQNKCNDVSCLKFQVTIIFSLICLSELEIVLCIHLDSKEISPMLLFSLRSRQKSTCPIVAPDWKNKLKRQQTTTARTGVLLTYFTDSQEEMSPVNGSSLHETSISSEDMALFHFYISPSRLLPLMKQFKGKHHKVLQQGTANGSEPHQDVIGKNKHGETQFDKQHKYLHCHVIGIVLQKDNTLYHGLLSFQVHLIQVQRILLKLSHKGWNLYYKFLRQPTIFFKVRLGKLPFCT